VFEIGHGCVFFITYIGPPNIAGGRLPHSWIVLCTAIVFVLFVIYTILVLRFAPLWLHYIILRLACLAFLIIMVLSFLDFGAYFISSTVYYLSFLYSVG